MAIDHKFTVVPDVCYHKPVIVSVPPLDDLYPINPRWPPDPDVLTGKTTVVDCDFLPGGKRYGQ